MGILILIILLSDLLRTSHASIAGITYMDNFDFEQRYRDINECNPFYWHPLHLPDDCAEMFQKAIRSGIKSNIPIRLVKKTNAKIFEIPSTYITAFGSGAEIFEAPITPEISYYGHPLRKMLELLGRNVKDHRQESTVGLLPNVGLVALYQQPISRKSEKILKKISNTYAPYMPYYGPMYSPTRINITNEGNNSKQYSEEVEVKKRNKKAVAVKKKIKKGDTLAIVKVSRY